MNPPGNIIDIYKSQGWNDMAAIQGDIAAGGWKSKVPSGGGSSGGGGGFNLDIKDIPSVMEFTKEAYAPADEALKSYVMALRGQKQPLDVYSELEEAAGLPGMKKTAATLREQIGGLEDTIRRVEGNVNATTKQSLVTEGQRAGMIEARQKPLLQNLGTLTTGLGRISEGITAAGADIGNKVGLYLKGQEQILKPYEVQVSALQDRAARLVSGFSADAQNTLSVLMAKWNRANELDDREVDQAFQILMSEKGYNQEIEKMKAQSTQDLADYEAKKKIDKKYTTSNVVPDTKKYYDTSSYYGGAGTKGISDLWNVG